MPQRVLRLLVRLYPASWRARYEEEFAVLLDDMPGARWGDLLDILKGALTMHLSQRRFWTRAALAGLAGLIIAFGFSLAQPIYYTSTATIESPHPETLVYVPAKALSRTSLADLMNRYDLYPDERRRDPLEDVVERMKRDLRIEPDRQHTGAFTVRFEYPDRVKARAVVTDLTRHLSVISAPSIADDGVRHWRSDVMMAGLALGLLAGVLIQKPWRWTLRMAAFGLAGVVAAFALSQIVPDRYVASALVLSDAEPGRHGAVAVREIGFASSGRVYLLSTVDVDRFRAQRTLDESLRAIRPQLREVIDPPSLPYAPASPNRLLLALLGAMAGVGLGLFNKSAIRADS